MLAKPIYVANCPGCGIARVGLHLDMVGQRPYESVKKTEQHNC